MEKETTKQSADMLMYYGGQVKALGDGRVGGYLVRYTDEDNLDLEGDFFNQDTYYGESSKHPVYYQHGYDEKMRGRRLSVAETKDDEFGKWAEAQLNLRDEYERFLYEMTEAGKMGWSSGAVGHLIEKERRGKGYWIKTWVIGEASLTPTPAEPKNTAVPIKSLFTSETDARQGARDSAEGDGEDEISNLEGKDMDEKEVKNVEVEQPEVEAAVPETVDVVQAVKEILTDELKGFSARLDEIEKTPVNAVKKVNYNRTPLGEYSGGECVKAWIHGDTRKARASGFIVSDTDISFGYSKRDPINIKAAMQEGTATEGGAAVPNDFYNRIIEKRDEVSVIRPLLAAAGSVPFRTVRDVLDFATEDSSQTAFSVTAEEAAYSENEPTMAATQVNVYKFTKLVKISEELLDDADDIDRYLASSFGRAAGLTENNYTIVGTGSSQPKGVFVGGSVGYTFADTNSITAPEVVSLLFTLKSQYHEGAAWITDPATAGNLYGLAGNNFQLLPTPPMSGLGAGQSGYSLIGKPMWLASDVADNATGAKTIMIGNWAYYAFVERQGMTISRNPYLYQANGQVGLFAKMRFGGNVLQSEAFKWGIQA